MFCTTFPGGEKNRDLDLGVLAQAGDLRGSHTLWIDLDTLDDRVRDDGGAEGGDENGDENRRGP